MGAQSSPYTSSTSRLALAAGLGRSTTGKALVTLEEHRLAIRTPGGHDGPRRTPDHWRAAPTGESTTKDAESGQETVTAESTDSASNAPEPSAEIPNSDAPADEATPNTSASADGDRTDAASVPVADAAPDAPAPDAEQSEDDGSADDSPHHTQDNDAASAEDAPAPQRQPTAPVEANALPGEKTRLAPGALRQMVINHLTAHPGEASPPRASAVSSRSPRAPSPTPWTNWSSRTSPSR
ncbi:hypothetical protein [Streptomyces sp. bgisy027]|uniref:hypothetical protein n=1 Tax=Streptomyces sp. bgisy027 TaxID=3413770 RepID=UPI003D75B5DA